MEYKTFGVTCLKCKGSDKLKITSQNQVFYTNHAPIISARFRPDMKWGFECMCGNDSRLSFQEKNNVDVLVQGAKHTIQQITKNLKLGNEKLFKMELI